MKDVFTTADLGVATTLTALGYSLDSLEQQGRHRCVFHFNNVHGLQMAIEHYWKGELMIDPKLLLEVYKSLKNRIYNS